MGIPANKYLHETPMRIAIIDAGLRPASSRLGSKLMNGWWCDRAPKRNRRG